MAVFPGGAAGLNPSAGLVPGMAPGAGDGSASGSTCGGSPARGPRPRFDEDVELPLIKVVVLGAPGVGKTSLVMVNLISFRNRSFVVLIP